jgi:hypothetical protein
MSSRIEQVLAEVPADIAELFDDFDRDRDHGQPIESTSAYWLGMTCQQRQQLDQFQASLVDPPTARYEDIHQGASF